MHYIGWFLLRIVMIVILSAFFGYATMIITRHLLDAWQKQERKKLWLCFSSLGIVLYLFLRGF